MSICQIWCALLSTDKVQPVTFTQNDLCMQFLTETGSQDRTAAVSAELRYYLQSERLLSVIDLGCQQDMGLLQVEIGGVPTRS